MRGARVVEPGLGPSRFARYPAYKDSGVEWLGEIPAHWEVVRLGWLATIGNGSTPARDDSRYWLAGSYPWLTSGKINEEVVRSADEFVTEAALHACHLPRVRAGSVLIALTGEGQTRGRAALLEIDSTISQHLAYATPRERRLRAEYLRRVIESRYEWLRFESSGAGSTRAALTCEFLRMIRTTLPPAPEQRAIAAFLDRETAKIDALVAKKERLIDLLQEKRTALITRAVTKGLDPNVPMRDSGVEWLGEIPAHWEARRVGTVADVLVGFPFQSERFLFSPDGVGLVRGDNITTGTLRWGDRSRWWPAVEPRLERYLLAEDDVVVGMDGSKVGRNYARIEAGHLPLMLVQRVTRLRPRAAGLGAFLLFSLANPRFHQHVDCSKSDPAIPHITAQDISHFVIAVPPDAERQLIADHLHTATAATDALLTRIAAAIDRLTELRTALITAAVTGKIDVRERVA